ncbi:hypothetical protein A3H22_00945 [Candidatus Peribacteria bacterium RIFCSPLOWO2_12_FULL_55_15]|nr:MAG: hypothetical protein A2789_00705 [Candidatus Peribacteria bacterium RIFCSPHIGHO2_01_FULL_54_22]OGJ63578.1 MAG: hypothetical protein A3D12_03985 [Candidatus Peribacteria bacterium RIFCSPHIGHO2_02_FULL_55_24]OGJ65152.1 MAG: hypothetical protein A3E47_03360 [Candidatus Peribacteria bacterium RIFCSPHIGHO2_12_FULL_54_10]OGJ68865.1 MAG: hypothetical protein A2947_03740 [Candidatus Peribacteria bacterium RIFCSPLOWO2_01_FULL_54_110]OGJ69566.1 MAG: hypothetical protein A3H90_02885 [Candidatus Pe
MPLFQAPADIRSQPVTLTASTEAQTYALFALAIGLTVFGVFLGIAVAPALIRSGMHVPLLIAELAIVFTARWWISKTPLNYLLFAFFPLLSGITVTPYLLSVLAGYVNGGAILLNALVATGFMSAAAAVFGRRIAGNLLHFSGILFLGVIGLLIMGVLQIFFPLLRTGVFELFISGGGILIFAIFLAVDLQRVAAQSRVRANPIILALSLYLDIFNLFLYILRFMIALSGERR